MTTKHYRRALPRYRALYEGSTERDRVQGRLWYPAAQSICREIAARYGLNWKHVARGLAALSPRLDWDRNIELTWKLAAGKLRGGVLPLSFDRGTRALAGERGVLHGRKVRSFAAALLGNVHAATVDTHMLEAAGHDVAFTLGRVRECQAALVTLAAETGENVRDLQAILWIVHKDNKNLPF